MFSYFLISGKFHTLWDPRNASLFFPYHGAIIAGHPVIFQRYSIVTWCVLINVVIHRWNYSVCLNDVIKWNDFPRYWSFVRGLHRSLVNCPHKGQWRGAMVFSLICAWTNGWVHNRDADDLMRLRAHYDITVMFRWMATSLYWDVP